MRKKRRQRATDAELEELEAAIQTPEVQEALEGEALARSLEEEAPEEVVDDEDKDADAVAEDDDEFLRLDTTDGDELVTGADGFQVKRTVESLLFAADRPLSAAQIRELLGDDVERKAVKEALDELVVDYKQRGMVLHFFGGAFQFRTHPTSASYVQKLVAGKPVRLSRAQLDTLAIVAYRQPITRPEIDDIRGVDSGATLKLLLERSLLRVLGKKEEPGRPLLYGTTKDFLEFFNLQDLRDLPTLREFHELNDDSLAEVEKLDDMKDVDVAEMTAEVAAARDAEHDAAQSEAALEDQRPSVGQTFAEDADLTAQDGAESVEGAAEEEEEWSVDADEAELAAAPPLDDELDDETAEPRGDEDNESWADELAGDSDADWPLAVEAKGEITGAGGPQPAVEAPFASDTDGSASEPEQDTTV